MKNKMKKKISKIPYAAYLLPFLAYILPVFFIKNESIAYAAKTILAASLLIIYRKKYNLKFRLNKWALITGILVFVVWIFIPFSLSKQQFQPEGFFLLFKLAGFLIIAPLVEELFTRDFLIRQAIALERKKTDFTKIKTGKFTFISFAISVLFFGFSHYMWAAGILAGILFNILLYKNKSIGDCVIAHAAANGLLAAYIITTNSWFLW